MALNPSGAISLAGPVAGQSIALELGLSPTAVISLNDTAVRTLAGVPSGTIIMPNNFWGKSKFTATQKAIFGYGASPAGTYRSMTNLVSNTGVVAADTPGVGTARRQLAAAGYGGDKAIFGYGANPATTVRSMTNLVSNTGVVAADTPGVGTARTQLAAAGYGGDKAIFGYGNTTVSLSMTNLVSSTGVVAADTPGVGTAREGIASAGYGGDKAIFGFGIVPVTNLVSNTGVVATNTPFVGTARTQPTGAGYGGDKAIFGFGVFPNTPVIYYSITNLVSNTGVVATNTPFVGTARTQPTGAGYGGDKAIFGFGVFPNTPVVYYSITNLVSNTGVVATNTPGVGTGRYGLAAAGYGGDKALFGFGFNPAPLSITNLVSNTGVVAADTPGVPGATARFQLAAAGYSST